MSELVRLIVRGYGDGVKLFEERLEVEWEALEAIAERQVTRVAQYERHLIEIELLDEPEGERFLRFGTDPRRMVLPIGVKL
jgi:hypothetical protein